MSTSVHVLALFEIAALSGLIAFHEREKVNTNIILSALFTSCFILRDVRPFEEPGEAPGVFTVLNASVILMGGLVGGVIETLLPRVTCGLILGSFLSDFTITAFLSTSRSEWRDTCIIALLFALSIAASFTLPIESWLLRTSVVGGWLLTAAVDSFFGNKFVSIFSLATQSSLPAQDRYTPLLLTVWVVATLVMFFVSAKVNGYLRKWLSKPGLSYISVPTGVDSLPAKSKSSFASQETFSYPDSLEVNYFDIDNLPDILSPYSRDIFNIAYQLQALYGFQIDNCRNQSEHLLMLLTNAIQERDGINLIVPAQKLHRDMFRNYCSWCLRVHCRNLLCSGSTSGIVEPIESHTVGYRPYIKDMLLFLLVWGEAGNLKHLPECLCLLFHKSIEEKLSFASLKINKELYNGFYLDHVIAPMYKIVAEGLAKSGPANEKRTYDDYNEFFWGSKCLQFSIVGDLDAIGSCKEESMPNRVHISAGMKECPKTYIEKRSWFHPLVSMRRLFEWHLISFTALAVWAFSEKLVWEWAFTIKVMSFIFLEITYLGLIWTSLEVWTLFPSAPISDPSRCGYVLRLLCGFAVLVYQSEYFRLAFAADYTSQSKQSFWWWQYMWISAIYSASYFIQSILCWAPWISSSLLTLDNDMVQAILNILYPFSQLYYGKAVHVSQCSTLYYIMYWVTALVFKLYFGYYYIVQPLTVPTLELYDDYMNFGQVPFWKTSLLMFVWWFPHYLVYMIDLSIWYSCWSSFVGGFVALVDRQGAVRDMGSLRENFWKASVACCQRLMPSSTDAYADVKGIFASSASLVNLVNSDEATFSTVISSKAPMGIKAAQRVRSAADLQSCLDNEISNIKMMPFRDVGAPPISHGQRDDNFDPTRRDIEGGVCQLKGEFNQAAGKIKSNRWVAFSRIWNQIIYKLRERDFFSNEQRDMFLFSEFAWLSKLVYLPLFQTTGCIESAIIAYKDIHDEVMKGSLSHAAGINRFQSPFLDFSVCEAVKETFELANWTFVRILGDKHRTDLDTIFRVLNQLAEQGDIFSCIEPSFLPGLRDAVANVVSALKACAKRKVKPVVTPDVMTAIAAHAAAMHDNVRKGSELRGSSGGMKKSNSTGFLAAMANADNSTTSFDTSDTQDAAVMTGLNFSSSSTGRGSVPSRSPSRFLRPEPFQKPFTLSDTTRDRVRDNVRNLLASLRNAIRAATTTHMLAAELSSSITMILAQNDGFLWSDLYASSLLDLIATDPAIFPVLNKLYGLLLLRQTAVDNISPEVIRRLTFFVNSLFMDMPDVPATRFAKEYTCMTPYYSEDVILSKADLQSFESDGVSTMLYLKTLYRNEWQYFLERIGLNEDTENLIWDIRYLQETRLWASLRAQTLYRTVEGMMHVESALRLICELEQESSADVLIKLKFNYVVACQVYGQMKSNLESKAIDIEYLLHRFPNLRVSYIDNVRCGRERGFEYYSVLLKADIIPGLSIRGDTSLPVKEIYRIKLAGNPVLGEGKPENQNHAIVFSRGRYLQAIDMNQDGYFEDALKMRNLLQEFDKGYSIVGFREHIFTGSVSNIANYMALQELSFVTLGQRVLANPLHIRQHYGHPDLFDKLFVMTEGGMSKATKGTNLSEDVFAGFNATIRGHTVGFKEYCQVGKGRDVGLQQTYKFEAKLSQGNAEQSLSRDMARICDRLDFFRLLSFYYGGIGHYIANTMVMFTLVVVVYCMLCLAIFKEEGVNGRSVVPEGILQLMLSGLGVLQTLPLAVTLIVEKGITSAVSEIAFMMLSGGPLYFIFHIQTKCYYFSQTLMAGGAQYRPTGRGFVIKHSTFDDNFRFFACSHIYLGVELMIALILYGQYTTSNQYCGLTWSLWMTVVSFTLGPFWFNPMTFELHQLQSDYSAWLRWIVEKNGSSEQSWSVWWREETRVYQQLSLSWKAMLVLQKCSVWMLVSLGLFGSTFWGDRSEQINVLLLIFVLGSYSIAAYLLETFKYHLHYAVRRSLSLSLTFFVTGCLAYMFMSHPQYFRHVVALYYVAASVSFVCLLSGMSKISVAYKIHDVLIGHVLFVILGVLAILQLSYIQTWLLYHNALSKGVIIDDVLKYARRAKEFGASSAVGASEKATLATPIATDHIANNYGSFNDSKTEKPSAAKAGQDLTGVPKTEGFQFQQPVAFPPVQGSRS